uniref:Uncharacterized protein n=1 Tax=Arundo donax TaxID=35708 RepID=A0A0A9FRN3_ARUDO
MCKKDGSAEVFYHYSLAAYKDFQNQPFNQAT